MRIKAVIWDLDGTLLDTLDDLTDSVNAALVSCALPKRTRDEVRGFVGNGVRRLMLLSVPGGEENPAFQAAYDEFVRYYAAHSRDKTRPYDGICALLTRLRSEGVRHAIVSNKIDFAVKELGEAYFPGLMSVCVGDDPSRRRKPAPDSVLAAMTEMGVSPAETVYVGDSDVDVLTAHNAGLRCCAVSWGFRSAQSLMEAGADAIADTPQALYERIASL